MKTLITMKIRGTLHLSMYLVIWVEDDGIMQMVVNKNNPVLLFLFITICIITTTITERRKTTPSCFIMRSHIVDLICNMTPAKKHEIVVIISRNIYTNYILAFSFSGTP